MTYIEHTTSINGIAVHLDAEAKPVMDDGWHWNFVGDRALVGHKVRGVHVMSRHVGGQIRGYVLDETGGLRLAGPCYTGEWPEMDAEVARVLGAAIIPYAVGPGGTVAPAATPSTARQLTLTVA